MTSAVLLRARIEEQIPSAFAVYQCPRQSSLLATGIAEIDAVIGGIPLSALTEICGSDLASSGKTSVMLSLLAGASRKYFCALVDAGDSFDPASAEAVGVNTHRLLWVRCGKNKSALRPLEQAFKVTDMLIQSGGFGLIVVDLSSVPERFVRKAPLTSWFRFSRVVEKNPTALVFVEQQAHATSCAGLVLNLKCESCVASGKLLTHINAEAEVLRAREKRPVKAASAGFELKAGWSNQIG